MPEKIYTHANIPEDVSKKEIQKHLDLAKKVLSNSFGIEGLTNIEALHLRHITEDCVKQYVEEGVLQKEGKFEDPMANRIQLPGEIVLRWLDTLYNISRNEINIHRSNVVWSMDDDTKYEFEKEDDIGPEKKIKQLQAQGKHSFGQMRLISSQFKEYIRRLREKAQIPGSE